VRGSWTGHVYRIGRWCVSTPKTITLGGGYLMADIDPPSQKEIWARKSRRQPSLAASSARPARRRAHRCWTCGRRRVKTARTRTTGPPATSQATQATRSATRTAQASQRATAILVVALRGRSGRRTSRAGRRPRSRRRGHRLGPPARAMIIVVGAALPAAGASRSAAPSLREVQGRHVRGWCCRRETRRMKTPPAAKASSPTLVRSRRRRLPAMGSLPEVTAWTSRPSTVRSSEVGTISSRTWLPIGSELTRSGDITGLSLRLGRQSETEFVV